MNSSGSPQTETSRVVVESLEQEFVALEAAWRTLLQTIPVSLLYQSEGADAASVGELILKSAGAVEQTFGGLTANLWDDPFEWTLPETLSTKALISEYLNEVSATRRRAFARLADDRDLVKLIAVPAGDTRPLVSLLIQALMRSSNYQARAAATQALITKTKSHAV